MALHTRDMPELSWCCTHVTCQSCRGAAAALCGDAGWLWWSERGVVRMMGTQQANAAKAAKRTGLVHAKRWLLLVR